MIRKTTTTLTALAASFVLIFGVTACGASDDDCKGDPGKVIEKDYDKSTSTSSADWDVTVLRDKDDTTYEKDVSSDAYDWVKVGSRWPSSKHCNADGTLK